jgi:hypothetical protein
MKRYHPEFVLYVLCLDEKVYASLASRYLKNIRLIHLSEMEEFYPELAEVKAQRKFIDYIFTLSPYYPSYILEQDPGIPFICSLDCDQFFFGNSEELFAELKDHSILIMPHRFSERLKDKEEYGTYNVSFQVFKNDEYGKECLKLWRTQCYDWCEDRLDGERFADQKYLNTWANYFGEKLKVIPNSGLGLAAWNIENYKITLKGRNVFIDDHKLILFHYQGLRFLTGRLVNSGFSQYGVKSSPILTNFVFKPIITELIKGNSLNRKDTMHRVSYRRESGIFNKINDYGMFYIFKNVPVSMELIYKFNLKKRSLHGIFTKFKNFYRSAR